MDSRTCTVRSEAAWPKLKTCMSFVWSKATSEISQSVQVVVSTGDKFDKKREEVLGCVGERGKRQLNGFLSWLWRCLFWASERAVRCDISHTALDLRTEREVTGSGLVCLESLRGRRRWAGAVKDCFN